MGQFWVKTIALSGSILNDRQQAIANELKRYGLEDEEQAFEAGCTVIPAPLPWLTNRTIGKTLKPSEDNYSDSGDFS